MIKVFTFEFYNAYEYNTYSINVLANSKEEAEELLHKDRSYYFNDSDINFHGCIKVIELDKPKVL